MTRRRWVNVLRAATMVAICAAAAASATSKSKQEQPAYNTAPQGQSMEPMRALGLWKSSFGAVKIEDDLSKGAAGSGFVHGVWIYQRGGQDVIGYFGGSLSGNVLNFAWQEPSQPAPLAGEGYLVFDPSGQRFNGRWWTTSRDRTGEWSGWRQEAQPTAPPNGDGYDPYGNSTNPYGGGYNGGATDPYGGNPYGGNTYGYGYPPPQPSPRPY